MTEHAHPIFTLGGYQLVALTSGRTYDPGKVLAYVVMTMSGARLHHERTLVDARSWMERRVEEATAPSPEVRLARTQSRR